MDVVSIIRRNVDILPNDPSSKGFKSVLRHIEAAFEHLARGQQQQADSAFTDAIYRANQAFEGSIKEAYRVLADKDPGRKSTHELEQYLKKQKVFKDRVLAQLTNYRQEWRNPSTHDHNLDFDEDEAFLAVMSVSAFAKLLLDQIVEKLRFSAVTQALQVKHEPLAAALSEYRPLQNNIADSIIKFMTDFRALPLSNFQTEMELSGALTAYLTKVHPDYRLNANTVLSSETFLRADLLIEKENENVVVEFKRVATRSMINSGLRQLGIYVDLLRATGGILFVYGGNDVTYSSVSHSSGSRPVVIIAPTIILAVET